MNRTIGLLSAAVWQTRKQRCARDLQRNDAMQYMISPCHRSLYHYSRNHQLTHLEHPSADYVVPLPQHSACPLHLVWLDLLWLHLHLVWLRQRMHETALLLPSPSSECGAHTVHAQWHSQRTAAPLCPAAGRQQEACQLKDWTAHQTAHFGLTCLRLWHWLTGWT